MSFENYVIESNIFIIPFVYEFLIFFFFSIIISAALKLYFKKSNSFFPKMIINSFKIILSVFIIKFVFFTDYETGDFIINIPDKMFIGSLFTGILAVYELISGILNFIDDIHNI